MEMHSGAKLDVEQTGKGRGLILLHSLLSDRTAFDRIAPRFARERRVLAGQSSRLRRLGSGRAGDRGFRRPHRGAFLAPRDRLRDRSARQRLRRFRRGGARGAPWRQIRQAGAGRYRRRHSRCRQARLRHDGRARRAGRHESGHRNGARPHVPGGISPGPSRHRRRAPDHHCCAPIPDISRHPAAPWLGSICAPRSSHPQSRRWWWWGCATPRRRPLCRRNSHANIPGARLVELPHCGHSPHIQDPEGFWNALRPFPRPFGIEAELAAGTV